MSKHPAREARRGRPRAHEAESPQAAGYRHERLTRILREEIAAVLRDEIADPRLDGVAITVVELSVDYKNARVHFVGPAGAGTARQERDRLEQILLRATPYLRRRLADAVELKAAPALRFAWDSFAAAGPSGE